MSRTLFTYAAYDAGLPCRNKACKSHGLPHPNCRCYGGLPESPNSATQMVLPSGRWGRDPSSFAGSPPTAVEPGEPKGPGSGGVPIGPDSSETAGNRLIGGDHSPIARDISLDADTTQTASNTTPVNAPFDYGETEATETDITPSGTNKPATGFGIGHLVAGAGLATLGLGMMGMNFFKRKKAPKEKESDYEDGVMALAEGGEVANWQAVDHYCQTCMPHQSDCEYFVEGGEVGAEGWVEETPGTEVAPVESMESPEGWVEETPGAPAAPPMEDDPNSGWVEETTGAPMSPISQTPENSGLYAGTAAEGARALGAQAEAFAKGLIGGPIIAGAEVGLSALGIPGLSAKDQAAREADLPVTTGLYRGLGTGMSFATGWGEAGLIGKIGGTFVSDLVSGGVFATLNEVEKAIVQGDDHEMLSASTIMHIGGQSLLSGVLGKFGRVYSSMKDLNLGTKFKSAAAGLSAVAANPNNPELVNLVGKKLHEASAQPGFKFSRSAFDKGVKLAMGLSGATETGLLLEGLSVARKLSISEGLDLIGRYFGRKIAGAGSKILGVGFLNSVQKDSFQSLPDKMDFIGTFFGGADTLNNAVGSLLKGHTAEWLRSLDMDEKKTKQIDMMHKALQDHVPDQEIQNSLIEQNNEAPQGFAEGGEVSNHDDIHLYHRSHDPKIDSVLPNKGKFDGLFFTTNREGGMYGNHIHKTKIPRKNVLTQYQLDYEIPHEKVMEAIRKNTKAKTTGELDLIHRLAVSDDGTSDFSDDDLSSLKKFLREDDEGEIGWQGQRIRGKIAQYLKYPAVEMKDETGTSYLVNHLHKNPIELATNKYEGGQVEGKQQGAMAYSHLADSFPEQAMALQMARGRMSTYLRSLQPQQQGPSLSFDSPPDTREQKRTYEKALLIAAQPLSVFGHIAKGTLEPEHIQHLNAIYPEVSNQMQKKLTENIMLMQMKGEKPSYKTRQGLSMLLGAPLSSEFIPANIQAAQAVFIPAEATQQPGAKPTKLKQSLSKSAKAFMTDDQSRQFRMQKQ